METFAGAEMNIIEREIKILHMLFSSPLAVFFRTLDASDSNPDYFKRTKEVKTNRTESTGIVPISGKIQFKCSNHVVRKMFL